MDKGFIRSILLSLFSSLLLGGWLILSMVAIQSYRPVDYYMLMSFFAFVSLLIFQAFRKKHVRQPKFRTLLNGAVFSIESLLFISIVNSRNIVMLSVLITLNIIIFTIINIVMHKEVLNRHIAFRVILSSLLIIAAVDIIYGFNQNTGFNALSQSDFGVAFLLVLLFGLTNYLFSYNSKRVINEENFIFWIMLTGFVISTLAFALFGTGIDIQRAIINYSMVGGLLLFAGISSMVYSYKYLANYKNVMRFVGTNVLFLLSEMDVVFISILYSIFIGVINDDIVVSIVLILISMAVISTVEDKRSQTNIFTHMVADRLNKEAAGFKSIIGRNEAARNDARHGKRANRTHPKRL